MNLRIASLAAMPRLARPVAFALAAGLWGFPATAQEPTSEDATVSEEATPVPPYALFQNSTLTASGNSINATWVPVVTAQGTRYMNLNLLFSVGPNGNLTVAAGYPKLVPSPAPRVSSFRAGTYVGPKTVYSGTFMITVTGPSIAPGGATEWSFTTPGGANESTYPGSGAWYVGPMSSSPWAARLKKAGITNTAWSYGVSSGSGPYGNWSTNTLIGVSPVGDSITFFSFGSSDNSSVPVDEITYKLKQP